MSPTRRRTRGRRGSVSDKTAHMYRMHENTSVKMRQAKWYAAPPPWRWMPDKASELTCRRRQRYKDAMRHPGGGGSAAVRSHTYRGKIRFAFPPHCAACVPPLLGRPLYRNSTVGQMDQDRFIIFVSSHYPVFKLNRRLGSTAPDLALCVSTSRRCGPLVAGEVKRPLSSCLPTSQVLL
jgi:hypothetical protein